MKTRKSGNGNSQQQEVSRLRRKRAELARYLHIPGWKYYLIGTLVFAVGTGGLNVLVLVESANEPLPVGKILWYVANLVCTPGHALAVAPYGG